MCLFIANEDTYLVADCYGDAEKVFLECHENTRLDSLRIVSDSVFIQDKY